MQRPPFSPAPPRDSLQQMFMQAGAHYQQGDLAGARRLLKQILRKTPQQFDTLHLLGVIESRLGHHKDGEKLLRQAVRVNPSSADAHSNRGNILREMGEYAEAVNAYDRALALKPDYGNAHNGRAIALLELGRSEEALASYDRALAFAPSPGAHYNRALALARLGRNEEALAGFDRALALAPDFLAVHVDRGNALTQLGRIDEALAAYDKVLAQQPQFPPALHNRALALVRAGRFEEALADFDKALAAQPDFSGALDGRGNVLISLGRYAEALESFSRAVKAAPDSAAAHNNRGYALLKLQRFAEALAEFDRAIALDRNFAGAHNNRGNVLTVLRHEDEALESFARAMAADPDSIDALANHAAAALNARRYGPAIEGFEKVLARDPDYPLAAGNLLHAKMQCCDWQGLDALRRWCEEGVRAGKPVAPPFAFLAISNNPEQELRAAQIWLADLRLPQAPPNLRRTAHDRIRLAYVSADFHEHPCSVLLSEVVERHDRSRFEISAISLGPDDGSALRARMAQAFDRFEDVRALSDAEVAAKMKADEIDIAIDMMGLTENCRPGIFALRPAPVQAFYLGYPSTTGMDFIDYNIADHIVIPPHQERHYAEKIAYLPGSFMVLHCSREMGPVPTRTEAGLPERGFVFCCFNNRYKIVPEIFDIWMRLLRQVEGSVLWLSGGNPTSMDNLRREAQARGVAPERLIFAKRVPGAPDHMARHKCADLFLDTPIYNAHATTNDALFAGLPVLTCKGESIAARVAASLITAAGLPEMVVDTPADYEARALHLARRPEELAAIREKLAANHATASLFDSEGFTRKLEAAYEEMWRRHLAGEPPQTFTVPQP